MKKLMVLLLGLVLLLRCTEDEQPAAQPKQALAMAQ